MNTTSQKRKTGRKAKNKAEIDTNTPSKKKANKAETSKTPKAKFEPADPCWEYLYAQERVSNPLWRVGGPTGDADGRVDTTAYAWKVGADASACWQIVDPELLQSNAYSWLAGRAPGYAHATKALACAKTLTMAMIAAGQTKWLPKPDPKLNLIPLRGQYLSIDDEGEIRCRAPDPCYGLTYCVGTSFDPSKVIDGIYQPQPPKADSHFGRYLTQTFGGDQALCDLAQEALSTVLINRCFERSIWMYGDGENGKSVLIHIMNAVVGGRSAPINLQRLVHDHFGTAPLHGARLAMVSEVPKVLTSNMQDKLKELISWDAQPLERKGRDAFTFRPSAVWLLASNALPRVSQHEHGFWRKVLTLPFDKRVEEHAKIADFHLLITENPIEMAQVLDWLLIGAQRLIRRGGKFSKVLPKTVAALALQQKMESDPVAAYLDDTGASFDEGTRTGKMSIYQDHRNWCEERGRQPLNETNFWSQARAIFRGVELGGDQQGPSLLKGGKRDRYVRLKVEGVEPLPLSRWPAGWRGTVDAGLAAVDEQTRVLLGDLLPD